MIRRFSIVAIVVVILTLVFAQLAFAAAQTYVDMQHAINVGVLIPRTASGLATPMAPYIFYLMDQRDDIKPHGWTFVNPLAGGNSSFKNYADYWLVSLQNTTYENLAKFDVLYMSADQSVFFPMSDRDKLRRYVDGGGCLWVDNGGNMKFPTGSTAVDEFFLPGISFKTGGGSNQMLLQILHPLVNTPFKLSMSEISSLSSTSSVIVPGYDPSFSTSAGFNMSNIPSPTSLSPIVVSSNSGISSDWPTIASIEYGSGRVVFTSGFIGGNIQGPVTKGTNPQYLDINRDTVNVMASYSANVKFAYNVVGYATSYTSHRKEYRRTACSAETLGAPLLKTWGYNYRKTDGTAESKQSVRVENSPVIWKGIIFYTYGHTLYALDANPETDIDMNGFSDDGQPDAKGADCDIIWSYTCQDDISSPTVATMLDPDSDPLQQKDFVLVTCNDGNVYIFDVLPADLSSQVEPRKNLWKGTFGSVVGDAALLPPVVQNGWIFVAGRDSSIHGYCPILDRAGNTSAVWSVPLVQGTDKPTIKAGPTLAYIKNQSNGAIVQMLSVVARSSAISDPGSNDHIYSLPVFVSSDRLKPVSPKGSFVGSVAYRSTYGNNVKISTYPTPEAWAIDGAGNSVSLDTPDVSAVVGQIKISASGSSSLASSTRVYMTYAIDYSTATSSYSMSYCDIPPQIDKSLSLQLDIAGTPAIGPNDMFYFGGDYQTSSGSGRSSVMSMWYDGNTNSSKLGFNYFLHGGGKLLNPSEGNTTLDPIKLDDLSIPPMPGLPEPKDVVSKLWGVHAIDGNGKIFPVRKLQVKGTPAVMQDKIFITASTTSPSSDSAVLNPSKGYLICLKNSQEPCIRLNRSLKDTSNSDIKYDVRVWQPDFLFPDGTSTLTPINAAAQVPSDMIDYDSGTITINDFKRIRLQGYSIAGVSTGMLTTSLPVWVFVNGQPVAMEQTDLSSWDSLLWAMAIPDHNGTPCSGVSTSPIVMGDYVYFTCDDGYVFAVPVDAIPDNTTKILDASKYAEMQERIDPSKTLACTCLTSLAGGNGMLVVPADGWLYAFKNKMNLVSDNRRVVELGTDGKIAWSCDSVLDAAPISGVDAGTVYGISPQPLSKPIVAQKYGGSDYLIVDSGNNRILRIDKGSRVMWSCSNFDDTKGLLRSGEPKNLKAPGDAIMWSEFEKISGEWYFLYHCLVADSGNFRIVDVVDRYYANSNRQILGPVKTDSDGRVIHELNWISRTTDKDKRFTYNSVKLLSSASGVTGYGSSTGPVVNEVWASLSNYGLGTAADLSRTESTGGGQLGGAIVSMKYRQSTAAYEWNYIDSADLIGQLTTLTASNGAKVALSGPTYFDVLDAGAIRLLICDSSAVYVTEGSTGNIIWDLTAAEYAGLNRSITHVVSGVESKLDNVRVPIPFSPYRAQMLPNNKIVVVNSFAGQMHDAFRSKFSGEVFEVDYNGPGSTPSYIEWYAPDLWREDLPTSSDPGPYSQKMKNSSNLDQPTSIQRLF